MRGSLNNENICSLVIFKFLIALWSIPSAYSYPFLSLYDVISYSMFLDNEIVSKIASKVDASEWQILSPPLKFVLSPLKWASSISILAFLSIATTAIKPSIRKSLETYTWYIVTSLQNWKLCKLNQTQVRNLMAFTYIHLKLKIKHLTIKK